MVQFIQVVMLGKEKTMKRKLISILLAAMICFSLSASVTAYNVAEIIDEDGEQILNNNCSHSWTWLVTTGIWFPDSGYCRDGYTLITRFEQCFNCGATREIQTIDGTRHSVTMSGGIVYCRICGKTF